jgi:hypothetical protein
MTSLENAKLPTQFAELQVFVEKWHKPGMGEQYAERLNSSMAELQEFYNAVKPRVLEIREYLDGKAFANYTDGDRVLGRLAIAWVPVAEAVEVFKQARVPDSKIYWEFVEEPQQF